MAKKAKANLEFPFSNSNYFLQLYPTKGLVRRCVIYGIIRKPWMTELE